MSRPRITAIVDTYNHERFIEQAIVSVLEQDFPRSEMQILVVDDGSTDRTPEILRKFESQVCLLHKANGGQASAFNVGISEARGDFIAFLDGDDWWAPNKLTRVLETFAKERELGFVGHGNVFVYSDGSQQEHALRESVRFQANTLEGAALFRTRGAFMGTSRMTVRAEVLKQIPAVPQDLTIQADEYLYTLSAAICQVRILTDPLVYYRLHDSNGFQMSTSDPPRMRRKQQVLDALARSLRQELPERGLESEVVHAITGRVQADADQLRLQLDGGWPWETLNTEWAIYKVLHPEAPPLHRLFKMAVLLAALAMPPRTFYGLQQKLTQSGAYARARKRWLPIPEMTHLQKVWRTRP